MRKGMVCLVTVLALISGGIWTPAPAAVLLPGGVGTDGFTVTVNGTAVTGMAIPFEVGEVLMVPARPVLTALGAALTWNDSDWSLLITLGSHTLKVWTDRADAVVDGRPISLWVAPPVLDGTLYIPVRPVAEALGASVYWDAVSRTERITISRETGAGAPRTPTGATLDPGQNNDPNVVSVEINGRMLAAPGSFEEDGIALGPMSAIAKAMGASVTASPTDDSLRAVLGSHSIEVWPGRVQAVVDGQPAELLAVPRLKDNLLYVSVRSLGEALGAQVKWELQRRTEVITNSHEDDVFVIVNGKVLLPDPRAFRENGATMGPMREVFELVGAEVHWDATERSETARLGCEIIKVVMERRNAHANGHTLPLPALPRELGTGAVVYAPLETIAKQLGLHYRFDENRNELQITGYGQDKGTECIPDPDVGGKDIASEGDIRIMEETWLRDKQFHTVDGGISITKIMLEGGEVVIEVAFDKSLEALGKGVVKGIPVVGFLVSLADELTPEEITIRAMYTDLVVEKQVQRYDGQRWVIIGAARGLKRVAYMPMEELWRLNASGDLPQSLPIMRVGDPVLVDYGDLFMDEKRLIDVALYWYDVGAPRCQAWDGWMYPYPCQP